MYECICLKVCPSVSHARVWNYDDALPVNTFENHKLSERGLSKLLLMNELDESLLLVGSSMPLLFIVVCCTCTVHMYCL
jgi:hypothetical protein